MLDGHPTEKELKATLSSAATGLQILMRKSYRHIFSHREWEVQVLEILCSSQNEFEVAAAALFPGIQTITADISEIRTRYSIPTAFRPCIQYLQT